MKKTTRIAEDRSCVIERCLGPIRFVPLSSLQAHRKKLQQLWEVTTYADVGMSRVKEWRDVPDEPTIP